MTFLSRRDWLLHALAPLAAACVLPLRRALAATVWADERVAWPIYCRANFQLGDYGPLINEIAQVQLDLVRTLGVPTNQEPIELYLFSDKTSYRRYLETHFPELPYRRAMFIKGGGPGMVFAHQHDEFAIDLRHESTHALLHGVLPMVPLWLDEGLAEYFEVPAAERLYDNPHLSSLRWNIRLGMMPKLRKLEQKRDLSEMGRGEYRYSWAWVHYMLHGSAEAHAELVQFLGNIRDRTPPGNLSDRLERRLPGIEAQLIRHFKGWKR